MMDSLKTFFVDPILYALVNFQLRELTKKLIPFGMFLCIVAFLNYVHKISANDNYNNGFNK